jgi:hypothetical protein
MQQDTLGKAVAQVWPLIVANPGSALILIFGCLAIGAIAAWFLRDWIDRGATRQKDAAIEAREAQMRALEERLRLVHDQLEAARREAQHAADAVRSIEHDDRADTETIRALTRAMDGLMRHQDEASTATARIPVYAARPLDDRP